jgi:hypothetical protein
VAGNDTTVTPRALVALFAAAVALSGCGAQAAEDAPSLEEVAAATRADPYRFELSLKSEGLSERFSATATGAADPTADRGVIRYSLVDEGGTSTLEVRRIGDATYTRFDAPELGGAWTEERAAEANAAVGPFGIFSEPHNAADALAEHGRDVVVGPGEPLDGVATSHYRGAVPTIEILGGGLSKKEREEFETEIEKSGSETAHVEAWAGPDRVLRRLKLTVPIREDGEDGRLLSEARFFDFGAQVDVQAPPASEIGIGGGVEGVAEPCRDPAAPHPVEDVVSVLRDAGFAVSASCVGEATMVVAYPKKADANEDVVFCRVARRPEPPDEIGDAVVAGNVACFAEKADRARLRTLLEGL